MPGKIFIHEHPNFKELVRIVAENKRINHPSLVEKDYWVMHCLYGLQNLGMQFELKGGTSLSKGFGIIDRFSEDIDIRITPPESMDVKIGRNQNKTAHIDSRMQYYDWLARQIKIEGVVSVERDKEFDDEKYRSAGIRLIYNVSAQQIDGIKEGVLLEVGFDNITPNQATDISSWVYDYACDKGAFIDNRALGVLCYHPGYTFLSSSASKN